MNEFAGRMSDLFRLPSDQIRLRHFDILYGYELKASFFNGTAKLERNADHVQLSISDASTAAHRDAIIEIVEQYSAAIFAEVDSKVAFSISLHATFESEEKYVEFFKPFGRCPEVLTEGIVATLKVSTWPESVRIVLENSLVHQNSMFILFNSVIALPTEINILQKIAESIGESAKLFGIELLWA